MSGADKLALVVQSLRQQALDILDHASRSLGEQRPAISPTEMLVMSSELGAVVAGLSGLATSMRKLGVEHALLEATYVDAEAERRRPR